MSEILPTLWLSGADVAYDRRFLLSRKITHVLNCAEELSAEPYRYGTDVTVRHIPMEDDETPEVEEQLIEAVYQIQIWQTQGHRVLVHCRAGISRSATVVLAWMMMFETISFNDAWSKLVGVRNYIRPNDYFMKFLKKIDSEPAYRMYTGLII